MTKLYAGVISDALQFDLKVNIKKHIAPSPFLYNLKRNNTTICGPAFTCLGGVSTSTTNQDRFRIEMLESITPGCIQVIDPGALYLEIAHYGDISALLAQKRGAAGCLIDGFTRDTTLLPKRFVVASSKGAHPGDAFGQWEIKKHSVPVEYCNITIHPGDFIHISKDGVIVIPKKNVNDVNKFAQDRAKKELYIRKRIKNEVNVLKIYDEESRW